MDRLLLATPVLDAAVVEQALDLARPTIEAALAAPRVSGERVLHVVVMDPQRAPANGCNFDDAVLAERAFGAPRPWGADYREFARAKARLAWRLQADTRWVHEQAPHLLRAGDTTLWGSACRDGLIVAASGAHPWFDEALCGVVLALLRGLLLDRVRGG
jgi:hypothetical protein